MPPRPAATLVKPPPDPVGLAPAVRLIVAARLTQLGRGDLAVLYEHCPHFYPNVDVPENDGLPWRGRRESIGGTGSPAAACCEA